MQKGLYAPIQRGLNIFTNYISEYSNEKGLYAPVQGRLNIFIIFIVEYINAEGALCPDTKRNKYFSKIYCRIY
jgi:hypothetical protein